jgi:hypothetical protein
MNRLVDLAIETTLVLVMAAWLLLTVLLLVPVLITVIVVYVAWDLALGEPVWLRRLVRRLFLLLPQKATP